MISSVDVSSFSVFPAFDEMSSRFLTQMFCLLHHYFLCNFDLTINEFIF